MTLSNRLTGEKAEDLASQLHSGIREYLSISFLIDLEKVTGAALRAVPKTVRD